MSSSEVTWADKRPRRHCPVWVNEHTQLTSMQANLIKRRGCSKNYNILVPDLTESLNQLNQKLLSYWKSYLEPVSLD